MFVVKATTYTSYGLLRSSQLYTHVFFHVSWSAPEKSKTSTGTTSDRLRQQCVIVMHQYGSTAVVIIATHFSGNGDASSREG
jgi:hypothetical protein